MVYFCFCLTGLEGLCRFEGGVEMWFGDCVWIGEWREWKKEWMEERKKE